MSTNSTPRRHKQTTPRFFSLALAIPGMTKPVGCTVTAFSRGDAHRQALMVLRGIKVRVVPPGILALLCMLAIAPPREAVAQGPVYTTGVDMVALTVTVTDAKGRSVSGLTAESFAVFEDGVRQSVSLFGGEDVPIDVGLALDTSDSMINALPAVKRAARAVVEAFRPGDRGAIIDIKDTIRIPQPLTEDRARLVSAIDALSAKGTTALYDGLYTTLREFERERRQRHEIRRHALVVLSDGVDTTSRLRFDDVTELARTLDVTIYTIALRDASAIEKNERPIQRAAWEMRTLASETGGLVFFPTTAAELPRIYDTIARELTSQYALGYVSSTPRLDGAFTRVALKLLPPAQGIARTRSGYLASGGSGSRQEP
jgi:Ca-activated chloride channel family protein